MYRLSWDYTLLFWIWPTPSSRTTIHILPMDHKSIRIRHWIGHKIWQIAIVCCISYYCASPMREQQNVRQFQRRNEDTPYFLGRTSIVERNVCRMRVVIALSVVVDLFHTTTNIVCAAAIIGMDLLLLLPPFMVLCQRIPRRLQTMTMYSEILIRVSEGMIVCIKYCTRIRKLIDLLLLAVLVVACSTCPCTVVVVVVAVTGCLCGGGPGTPGCK